MDTGHRPISKTTSRFVTEAFSFLDVNDDDTVHNNKDSGTVIDKADHSEKRSYGSVGNINGVYTIVTSVQDTKPNSRTETGNNTGFRIVDYVGTNTGTNKTFNSVYVVDDEADNDLATNKTNSPSESDNKTEITVIDTVKDVKTEGQALESAKDFVTENTEGTGAPGKVPERNSVIVDGEEVFLRNSPRDSKNRSPRQPTWKTNQNVVSEAFGFLKESNDPDDERFTSNLDKENVIDENTVESESTGEHISRSGRQATWKAQQNVVSEAFGFLKEADGTEEKTTELKDELAQKSPEESDLTRSARHATWKVRQNVVSEAFDFLKEERLSSNSAGDAEDILQHEMTGTVGDEENKLNTATNSAIKDLNNKPIGRHIDNSESHQSNSPSSKRNGELELTNQKGSSAVLSANQRVVSETGSVYSEGLGDLEGFKKYKFRSNNNGDDDGDSSDEDVGVYRESFRKSTWLYIGDGKNKGDKKEDFVPFTDLGLDTCDTDSVFGIAINDTDSPTRKTHKRQESTSTTASESEFRANFNSVSKRFVKRADSQQEYKRYTQKFYDNVETYKIEKTDRDSFGIHILDSKPAVVSGVDEGSPAERAGLKEGQVVITVNGINVLDSDHNEIIDLVHKNSSNLSLQVGSGDLSPVLDLQLPVLTGHMQKQTSSTIFRLWKKRFFILRRDNCLYYYKNENDTDPLGAIPLQGYTVSRHGDGNKFGFKAEKYHHKTFFFLAESREDMTRWVGALNEAGKRQDEKKDAWMEVTANNVGLPALEIRKPDCTGYLNKLARATKRWRKRYCVLKDACIYYYKNSNSKEAEGVAHLHGYRVNNLGVSSKKFSFCLEPPEEQMRVFTFYAENETDKQRWVDALNTSIQKWIKVD